MVQIICSIIGTGIVVITAIGGLLKGFYKTNTDAKKDLEDLEEKINGRLDSFKLELELDMKERTTDFKGDLSTIAQKIDEIKNHYVSNENFKIYADAMNRLLQMSNDRMVRMENTLDDIRNMIEKQ